METAEHSSHRELEYSRRQSGGITGQFNLTSLQRVLEARQLDTKRQLAEDFCFALPLDRTTGSIHTSPYIPTHENTFGMR